MNLENQLLEKFQVEELEKRFETGRWVKNVYNKTCNYDSTGFLGKGYPTLEACKADGGK
ncbi:hypothetical protein [Flavobacterium sp. LAR06]|uniref:hypothetical protein n=1 Tax=Flavobacterium sp. LAR06 TaxID=3064897 RepID=UPI0035BEEA61